MIRGGNFKFRDREFYPEEFGRPPIKRPKIGDMNSKIEPFRTLCVSHFNQRMIDEEVQSLIYKEFAEFGDFGVVFLRMGNSRIAHVNFRYFEDAQRARMAFKNKLLGFDNNICIEPIYDNIVDQRKSPFKFRDDCRNSPHPPSFASNRPWSKDIGGYNNNISGMNHDLKALHKPDKFLHNNNNDNEDSNVNATRTLFVGNLDFNITIEELRHIFEQFGLIEDIDIKRNSQTPNVYSFIRFFNLDMAQKAKSEMSGKCIGPSQCRIGYGKATPTNCLWIGGLGPWMNKEDLFLLFNRFGDLRIEWPLGKTYAYLIFSSVENALNAHQSMQGYDIGPGKYLKIDFSDESHIASPFNLPNVGLPGQAQPFNIIPSNVIVESDQTIKSSFNNFPQPQIHQRGPAIIVNDQGMMIETYSQPSRYYPAGQEFKKIIPLDKSNFFGKINRNLTQIENNEMIDNKLFNQNSAIVPIVSIFDKFDPSFKKIISECKTAYSFSKLLRIIWRGEFQLKLSSFPMNLHLLCGDPIMVDNILRDFDLNDDRKLKIIQRLNLESHLIENISESFNDHQKSCIFLAMPIDNIDVKELYPNGPLRNLATLVSYLKIKRSTGVVKLPVSVKSKREIGLLHLFTSCTFANDLLIKFGIGLDPKYLLTEDFLVVIFSKGLKN